MSRVAMCAGGVLLLGAGDVALGQHGCAPVVVPTSPVTATRAPAQPSPNGATPPQTPSPSAATVEVTPTAVMLDGSRTERVAVVVGNTGTGVLQGLSLTVTPPPGVTWEAELPADGFSLGPQDKRIVGVSLSGRRTAQGTTSVLAQGRSGGRIVAAVATITHPAAPALATMAVSGPAKLTNSHDLDLVATVTNLGDTAIKAEMDGSTSDAGKTNVHTGCPQLIPPGDAARFEVRVEGSDLRTGNETAMLTATVSRDSVQDVLAATHAIETSPFGDTTLIGPIGLASLLLLPGLGAVVAWALVRTYPRRKRGVLTSALPDIKSLATAIAVVLLSAGAAEAYRLSGRPALYDGYSVTSLAQVTLGATVASFLAGLLRWAYVDWKYPVLQGEDDPRRALGALRSWWLPGATIENFAGRVVWVHDGAACVLSGLHVLGTVPDGSLDKVMARKDLRALKKTVHGNDGLEVVYAPTAGGGERGARTGAVGDTFRPLGRAEVIEWRLTR